MCIAVPVKVLSPPAKNTRPDGDDAVANPARSVFSDNRSHEPACETEAECDHTVNIKKIAYVDLERPKPIIRKANVKRCEQTILLLKD